MPGYQVSAQFSPSVCFGGEPCCLVHTFRAGFLLQELLLF